MIVVVRVIGRDRRECAFGGVLAATGAGGTEVRINGTVLVSPRSVWELKLVVGVFLRVNVCFRVPWRPFPE